MSLGFTAIPSHQGLFGYEASEHELIALLKKHPVDEWLSYLSRIQNRLSGEQALSKKHVQHVIAGTVSKAVHAKLIDLEKRCGGTALAIYYERQLSTLQQMAILHAPEGRTTTFDNDEGRHDLSMALLMTMDVMNSGRESSGSCDNILPTLIQDAARTLTTKGEQYAIRAWYFYELAQSLRSDTTQKYLAAVWDCAQKAWPLRGSLRVTDFEYDPS